MGKKSKRARREREIQTKISNLEGIVVGKLKPHQYEGLQATIDAYHGGKSRFILEPKPCRWGKVDFVSTPGASDDHVKRAFEQIKAACSGLGVPAAHLKPKTSAYLWPGIDTAPLTTSLKNIRETLQGLDRREREALVARQKSTYEKLVAEWRAAMDEYKGLSPEPLVASKGQWKALRDDAAYIEQERRDKVYIEQLKRELTYSKGQRDRLSADVSNLVSKLGDLEYKLIMQARRAEKAEAKLLNPMVAASPVPSDTPERIAKDLYGRLSKHFYRDRGSRLSRIDELLAANCAMTEENRALKTRISELEVDFKARDMLAMSKTTSCDDEDREDEREDNGNPGQRCDTCAHASTAEFRQLAEPSDACLGCEPSRGADGWEQRNTITVPPSTTDKARTWIEMLDPATRKVRQPKILLPEEGRIFELISISGDKGEAPRSLGFFVRTAALRDRFMGARLDIYHEGAPVSFMYITGINCPDTIVARTAAWSYAPEKE